MILAVTLATLLAQGPKAPPKLAERDRTVTKASVYLVQQPSFLAPRAGSQPVYRGDKVRLEGPEEGSWLRVSAAQGGRRVQGYVHASYVTDRRVAFKVEQKEVEGRSTVSGHYNLAVGGFREEIARKRQASSADSARGYQLIDKYMPLQVEDQRGKPLPKAARARLLPPEMALLRRFIEVGDLRRQERPPAAAAPDAAPTGGAR